MRVLCKVKDCGGESLYTFGKQPKPFRCAVCGEEWPSTDPFYGHMNAFLSALKFLKDSEASSPVTLL